MIHKISASIFFLIFLGYLYFSTPIKIEEIPYGDIPHHREWNNLLQKNVTQNGDVNYKSFLTDKANLQEYLNYLEGYLPAKNWSKNHKLAYYINLYNARTVKLILDNYPTNSIKDINSPWTKKIINIGKNKFSLGNIEHKILRKMNEPRIHFAINCASYSCPKLLNKAYTANNMEKQLIAVTKSFISDKTKNYITKEKVQLSKIFKWYKNDFTEKKSLIDYINQYSEIKILPDIKIDYLDYNWALNEAK